MAPSDKVTPNNETSELQAILTQQADTGICLLRDSPFRILRVSNMYKEKYFTKKKKKLHIFGIGTRLFIYRRQR